MAGKDFLRKARQMDMIEQIKAALEAISAPSGQGGLVSAGRVSSPRFEAGRASLVLDVTGLNPAQRDLLDKVVHEALERVDGITEIRVAMTAEKRERAIIAVASGKGGVGKSTLSANLAIALARVGRRPGLVDADIYGPSQPRLMATEGMKPTAEEKRLIPIDSPAGIPMLSMGHLVKPGQAVAWRGPMAGNALSQLIDADWGACDTLIVDMPPGTGDVQLSMVQKHKPTGAVIVSTPQDLALIDATRAIDLFNQTGVPIIGIVENMSGYLCPHCGESSDPFGNGGAERAASDMGIPFLGRVPLDLELRLASDAGTPPSASGGPQAEVFAAIAGRVATWISNRKA